MHKYQDPNKAPLFRGGERMRLMATIGSLAVIGMLIVRARDPHTWRWFAGVDDKMSPSVLEARDRELGRAAPQAKAVRPVNPPRHFYVPDPPLVAALPPNVAAADGMDRTLALAQESPPVSSDAPATAPQQPSPAPPSAAPASPAASPPARADGATGLADDVPPPAATLDPKLAEKPRSSSTVPGGAENRPLSNEPAAERMPAANAEQKPEAAPGTPSSATARPNAANPNAAGLADDVPPPEATIDPKLADTSGSSSASPVSAEYPLSIEGRAADNMPPAKIEEVPIEEDPIELNDFREEIQAITDKKELRVEEMSAYWRLMDWQLGQKFKDMEKRARPDLMYSHLFKDPEKYRGKLVRLKLRIIRATATDADENGKARGLARTYEAWGYTEESAPNQYAIVLTSLPGDFPLKHDMQEDVTFVGYFFKLMAIQSRDDKHRAVPVLIGQVFWHQNPAVELPFNVNWLWAGGLGIMAIVMLVVRVTFNMRPLRPRSVLPPLNDGDDAVPIETWLQRIEETQPGAAPPSNRLPVNGHADGELPTNGASQRHPEKLSEDPES